MSRTDKLLLGFIIGAIILGTVGFFLAPSLLGIAGVAIGHASVQTTAVISTVPVLIGTPTSVTGVTAAVFGQLQMGITILTGLIGGLGGGLIGMSASKAKNSSTPQYIPSSPAAQINNTKTNGYSPELDIDGKNTEKSFVENYKQEKLENLQVPTQWRM